MSFRKYGGMNYAATHNIVKSNVNTSDSLYVTNNVGQTNSYINFDSDISGNVLIFGDLDLSGNLNVSGDIDCSGNLTVYGKSYLYDDTDISGNLTVTNDVLIDGSLNVIGNIDIIGALDASAIYLPGTKPSSSYADNEVVPKSYVDTASQGLNVKTPCDCIATYYSGGDLITDSAGNPITFNVTSTYTAGLIIDGYDLSANFSSTTPSRVLVNDQGNPETTAAVLNGIYVVSGTSTSISFVRSSDMPNGSDALGVYTFIQNGTVYGRSSWVQNQKINNVGEPVIVGTNVLFFSEYQSFKYRLGRGLDLLFDSGTSYTYLNLDTSLNAVNYLDNSYTGAVNPGSNTDTINIGAYTTNINIGSTNQTNQINITGNASFTQDISVNSLTVGRGSGNVSYNSVVGYQALNSNTDASMNSAFGYQALNQNTSGTYNTAVGYQALQNNLSSAGNTAVGCSALNLNQVGYYNTAVGSSALSLNTAGNNTAVGCGALEVNTTGSANTSIGMQSSFFNKTGGANTASGFQALQQNLSGSNNTAAGCQALVYSTTDSNTAFGTSALYFNTDGSYNTAIGYLAGSVGDASHNSSCTFLGYNTGNSSPAGVYAPRTKSTAIGYNAVISSDNQIVLGTTSEGVYIPGDYLKIGGTYNKSNSSGYALDVDGSANFTKNIFVNSLTVGLGGGNVDQNTALGYNALQTNVGGTCNTAIGYTALQNIIGVSGGGNGVGRQNTAVGHQTLTANTYGNSNTAVGFGALVQTDGTFGTTIGSSNTAVGDSALTANTTGYSNTAFGTSALASNTTGYENTASGYLALYTTNDVSANYNTAFGVAALYSNTTGYGNTAIGWQSGNNSGLFAPTGVTYCTFLGGNTGSNPANARYTNSTAIGYNSIITASNQIVLGTSSEGVYLPGDYLQIGSATYKGKNSGGFALDVTGSTFMNVGTTGTEVFPLILNGPSAQTGQVSSLNFGFNIGNGGYTGISREKDNIIWWSDAANIDVSAALVIAPYNTGTGIRVSTDGLSVNTYYGTSTTGYALYVTGNSNFTGAITSSATQPVSSDSSTKVPTTAWVQSAIAASSTVPGAIPIGGIIMWSSSPAPTNWAICDGGTYNNIATPDLRDRFIVGAGNTYQVSNTGGASTVTLTTDEMPSHNHTITITDPGHAHQITDPGHNHGYVACAQAVDVGEGQDESKPGPTSAETSTSQTGISINQNTTGITASSQNAGTSGAHENRPPYYALYYIMRVA